MTIKTGHLCRRLDYRILRQGTSKMSVLTIEIEIGILIGQAKDMANKTGIQKISRNDKFSRT